MQKYLTALAILAVCFHSTVFASEINSTAQNRDITCSATENIHEPICKTFSFKRQFIALKSNLKKKVDAYQYTINRNTATALELVAISPFTEGISLLEPEYAIKKTNEDRKHLLKAVQELLFIPLSVTASYQLYCEGHNDKFRPDSLLCNGTYFLGASTLNLKQKSKTITFESFVISPLMIISTVGFVLGTTVYESGNVLWHGVTEPYYLVTDTVSSKIMKAKIAKAKSINAEVQKFPAQAKILKIISALKPGESASVMVLGRSLFLRTQIPETGQQVFFKY